MSLQPDTDRLTDEQWNCLSPLMPGGCKGKRGRRSNNRLFMDAVLWMARSGARWRDLPERFGRYGTVKQRYYEWVNRGFFQTIFNALNQDCDFEWLCVDATVVRAHTPEKRGPEAQGLGRSRGGLSTKIHAATDALGNPARLLTGPGQQGDVKRALELIEANRLCLCHRRPGI